MFNLKYWLNLAIRPQEYIWIEAIFLKETPKAILIEFDGKQIWLPKAWILRIKRNKDKLRHCEPRRGEAISLKIALWHWVKKMQ